MALEPDKIIQGQAHQLFQASPASALVHLFIIVTFNSLFYDRLDTHLLTIWSIVLSSLVIARVIIAWQFNKKEPTEIKLWLNLFTFVTLLVGIAWACFSLFYLTTDDIGFKYLFIVLACGVMSAAVPVLAAWTPAYLMNTFPQFTAIQFILLQSNDLTAYYLAASLLVFYAMLISLQRNANQNIRNALLLQRNNDDLVLKLNSEIEQREQILKERTHELNELLTETTAIVETPLVGIVTVRNRHILWANSAFESMLGYDKNELNGCPTRQCYVNEEDYLAIGEAYASIEREGVIRNELEFVRKDSQHIWFDMRGTELDNEAGDSLWVFVDVTERKQAELSSARSETKFRAIFDTSRDAVMTLGETHFIDGNVAALALFGCETVEELCTTTPAELSPLKQPCGTNSTILAKQWIDLAVKNGSQHFEWVHKRADTGETFPADVLISASKLNGKLLIQGTVRDISEKKRIEADLRIAATAFESQEGMMVTDANSVILRVNKAFTTITGYNAEEVIGNKPSMLSSGQHDALFYDAMWQAINTANYWEGEVWNKRKNGDVYPEQLTITAVRDSNGNVTNYVATLTDITQSKQAEQEIEDLAYYDPLTHLPNRRLMIDRIHHAMAASTRSGNEGALLFLDLDRFKTLNDTHGHDMGDILLQQVADRLTDTIREGDTVSRFGGDEFVILLEGLSAQPIEAAAQTEDIANKILSSINRPYQLASHQYNCTTSIGIALFDDHKSEVEDLLKHADIALYKAKDDGRDTLRFFDPQMQASITARVKLEKELNQAIEQKQFQLYYQPQVDHSQNLLGAEALIRWNHPERGLVPPIDFIPVAEQNGTILVLGQWVLDTACEQLKVWRQDTVTHDLTLSVNVSAKQFRQPSFVSQVIMITQQHDINPTRLKLELTESLLLDNIEDTIAKMNALAKVGIQFSLDDFGTGYSSLQYLKRLPLYQLKIDKSFVDDLVTDSNDEVIVRTIIAMAHSLGLSVIAEGVETKEQQKCLLAEGCTHYQGYLYSKPVPLDRFEALINKG